MNSEVDILLSTYNGENYLKEQIDSLLGQTYQSFRLLVRDDGSTDQTVSILERYREKDSRIQLLPVGANLRTCQSFARLMEQATASYIFFCDQDDFWFPSKLEISLKKMKSLEERIGKEKPLLLHSDAVVVNQRLERISPSFWNYAGLHAEKTTRLSRLLAQNVVTGCTTLINRALLEASLPIPKEALMHDWWLALVAAGLGQVECLSEATLLYRQHERNVLGAKKYGILGGIKKIFEFNGSFSSRKEKLRLQGNAYLERLGEQLSKKNLEVVSAYLRFLEAPFLEKRYLMARYGFWKSGLLRKIAQLLGV